MTTFSAGLRLFRRTLVTSALAATTLPSAALAYPGITLVPAYMYVAPTSRSPIAMHVPPDASIDIEYCRGGWCHMSWRYRAGFMAASQIRVVGTPRVYAPRVYVQPVYAPPPYGPTVVVPIYGGRGYTRHHHW